MKKHNILLALTGSVATTLASKIVKGLQEAGNVKVVMTSPAAKFYNPDYLHSEAGVDVFIDEHEWNFWAHNSVEEDPIHPKAEYHLHNYLTNGWLDNKGLAHTRYIKDFPVLHIELRKWADVLVIAPLSANTLAKMANGLCDNLLTNVVRAWDPTKPIIVAPAMNTEMWKGPFSLQHLNSLRKVYDFNIVSPQIKILACGDVCTGAMAQIENIINAVQKSFKWRSPLPIGEINEFHRKYDNHTGVDLYTNMGASVSAVEGGTVVAINHFTGPQIGMPWWLNTDAILIEGYSGVVGYCEITPKRRLKVGDKVQKGECIGEVSQVLKYEKKRDDIPGHSIAMLHMELYPHGTKEWGAWVPGEEPKQLDPTPYLLEIEGIKTVPDVLGLDENGGKIYGESIKKMKFLKDLVENNME